MWGRGGEKGLAKGERREVWEKGLMRKGRCSLKKMRVVFFFKISPSLDKYILSRVNLQIQAFKYIYMSFTDSIFLRQQSFEFTRNCIVQNLQNGRSKMQ